MIKGKADFSETVSRFNGDATIEETAPGIDMPILIYVNSLNFIKDQRSPCYVKALIPMTGGPA
jgi:hypothetical protein